MNYDNLLVYKWLKSENTSSKESQRLARKTREAFEMTPRDYRKMLSEGRKACNLVETLMSQGDWDSIDFSCLPSRAGILYSKAFARREETKERYAAFMRSEKTTVNANTLYPYDVVKKATQVMQCDRYSKVHVPLNDTERLAANKYWENLNDSFFKDATLNALCVADTSSSMTCAYGGAIRPIDIAISLALFTAERAQGPFHGHYISFSSRPQLIATEGVDFCDKVERIYRTNLCANTNIEATFDMILQTAVNNHLSQDDLPETLIVVSDMQLDAQRGYYGRSTNSLMENIEIKWNTAGYKMPRLVYWNVNASSGGGNIPMKDKDGVTYVSGASPSIFTSILTGKTGVQLMLDAICSARYDAIYSVRE